MLVLRVNQENWSGMELIEFLDGQFINKEAPSPI